MINPPLTNLSSDTDNETELMDIYDVSDGEITTVSMRRTSRQNPNTPSTPRRRGEHGVSIEVNISPEATAWTQLAFSLKPHNGLQSQGTRSAIRRRQEVPNQELHLPTPPTAPSLSRPRPRRRQHRSSPSVSSASSLSYTAPPPSNIGSAGVEMMVAAHIPVNIPRVPNIQPVYPRQVGQSHPMDPLPLTPPPRMGYYIVTKGLKLGVFLTSWYALCTAVLDSL